MLQNTLQAVEQICKRNNIIEECKIELLLECLSYYKAGSIIYPGVIKRKLDINIKEVYHLLDLMEKEELIISCYELYCKQCKKTSGLIHTFKEIPDYFMCDGCDTELSGLENAILIYKVQKDD